MYQAQSKRKHGKLWLVLLLFSAIAIGFVVGFASVKINKLPDQIHAEANETPHSTATPIPQEEVSDEPNKTVSGNTDLSAETEKTPSMPPKEGYLVQTSDGKVCVFKIDADGTTKFLNNIAVNLNDLPVADREKLSGGIYVETKTELAELMEDYSS